VTLTVTDDDAASSQSSQVVNVSTAGGGGITLSASGYKVKGVNTVGLSWTGAAGSVDLYRNAAVITTTSGSSYTDNTGSKGGATYTYKVCTAGTSTCSASQVVSF